jgi:hypothetical protein
VQAQKIGTLLHPQYPFQGAATCNSNGAVDPKCSADYYFMLQKPGY